MSDKLYCACDPNKPGAYGPADPNAKDKFLCDAYADQCKVRYKCGTTQCEPTIDKTGYDTPDQCNEACTTYNCLNGVCTPEYKSNGPRFTKSQCLGICGKYECTPAGCRPGSNGVPLPQCEQNCNKYHCQDKAKRLCVPVFYPGNELKEGDYKTENCDDKCKPDPRYICDNGTCVDNANGYLTKCPTDDGCKLVWTGTVGSPACAQEPKILAQQSGRGDGYPEEGNCLQAMKYSCKNGRCVIDPTGTDLKTCYDGCKPAQVGSNLLLMVAILAFIVLVAFGFYISGKK